jgi:hypothetical protein
LGLSLYALGTEIRIGTPEFSDILRDGAIAKYSLRIVDDDGAVVSNASIKVSFAMDDSEWITGWSGTNGYFSASGRSRGEMLFRVNKDGYYQTKRRITFGRHDGVVVRDGKWQPWNSEITVVIREVLNPIPMFARIVDTKIPPGEYGIGFDLKVGDWTEPFGKGIINDFVFNIDGFWRSYRDNDSSLKLTFSNHRDGMIGVNKEKTRTDSGLLMPRYAPEEGYQNKWSWRRARKMSAENSNDKVVDDLLNDGNFFFRVRSLTNDLGIVTNALYGKIYGNFEFIGAASDGKGSALSFTYYLNPTPNDRNMEFDPKQNLFKNLKSLEQVTKP